MDRNLGNESAAVEGFEEAIQCLEKLKLDSEQTSLEQRVAIIDPHYSSSACICFSELTFIMHNCSASRFLTSYTTNWQINKSWSSPKNAPTTDVFSWQCPTPLLKVPFGRSWPRSSDQYVCLPPFETFVTAQNKYSCTVNVSYIC